MIIAKRWKSKKFRLLQFYPTKFQLLQIRIQKIIFVKIQIHSKNNQKLHAHCNESDEILTILFNGIKIVLLRNCIEIWCIPNDSILSN